MVINLNPVYQTGTGRYEECQIGMECEKIRILGALPRTNATVKCYIIEVNGIVYYVDTMYRTLNFGQKINVNTIRVSAVCDFNQGDTTFQVYDCEYYTIEVI